MGWLHSALGRLSLRARVIALAALFLGTTVLALAPTHEVGDRARRPAPTATTMTTTRGGGRRPSLASAAQVARARHAARRFLAGYLPFAYGRASAGSVEAVTPALRRQLRRERVQLTPVEHRRRPWVLWLTALARSARAMVVTALVDDGGIANYAVRLTVRRTSRGWLVSSVDGG